jgi:hypothetical protein
MSMGDKIKQIQKYHIDADGNKIHVGEIKYMYDE